MFKRILVLGTILAFLITPVNAWERIEVQKNDSLTLEECLNMGLHNLGAIRRAYMTYQMAVNSVGIAKSAYMPTLSAGVGLNVNDKSFMSHGGTSRTFPSIQATLNQLIWDFGKTSSYIRMFKFNKIMAKLQFQDLLHDNYFNIQKAYYGVLASKSYVDVGKANVQINLRDYNRTKAFFDEGIRSKVDIVNSEYNLAQARIALIDAETTYQSAWVALNNSMSLLNPPEYEIENTETFSLSDNYYPASFLASGDGITSTDANIDVAFKSSVTKSDVVGNYKYTPFPYTFEEAVEYAYEHRHDLQALKASRDAMAEEVKYIKRQYYPALTGNLGYEHTDTRVNSNNNYTLGVNLSSSINIKKVKHEIDNAKLQLDYADSEIGSIRLAIFCEVQDAYIRTVQLEKQIPLAEVKVRQALENLELSEGRYEVGIGDFIELQDARVNYTNACNSYVKLVYDYNIARATLENVMCLHHDFCDLLISEKEQKENKKKNKKNA